MKRIINENPELVLETPLLNTLERLAVLIQLMNKLPIKIDSRKFAEAQWLILNGHSTKAQEEFTRERIFWLIDDKSNWIK